MVKADGYGHGDVQSARAALAGGARWLAVATAEEARRLRAADIAAPVLVMGALSDDELDVALHAGADVVAWRQNFITQVVRRAHRVGVPGRVGIHVKLDTGMGRLGIRDEEEATAVAEAVDAHGALRLAGAMTHFATADDDPEFLTEQLSRFEPWAKTLKQRQPDIISHAANSAAALRAPEAHFDMVRCGIGIYGCDPFHFDPAEQDLEPALQLESYVAEVKPCAPGESAGYGRRWVAEKPSWVATVPIGYGDGFRRAHTNNGDVLIDGRRFPIVGTVSMDNVTVLVGEGDAAHEAPPDIVPGMPAVLIGRDGDEVILAEEVARAVGTINYEVTCAITARVPREPHRDGELPPSDDDPEVAA